jgi:hypothetical protein
MIIIISYDKQVTMFFSKLFMNSYTMEHLPKMSHHIMHSPFYTTKFSKVLKKNKKNIWNRKWNSLKWNHLTLLVITWNDWMVDGKLACQYEGEGFYSLLWHLVHIFKAYKWPKDLTHAILIWRWFLFMVRFSFSTLDFKILECIFHSFRFINEFVMNEFMIFKLWILSNIWIVLSCLISKGFKVK